MKTWVIILLVIVFVFVVVPLIYFAIVASSIKSVSNNIISSETGLNNIKTETPVVYGKSLSPNVTF